MKLVMDSCALIALLRNEPGADVVQKLVDDPENACFIHAVNLCEIFYDIRRQVGEARAQLAMEMIEAIGISACDDMDPDFWRQAGRYKCDHKLPLGDCFCLAAADRVGGAVVTSDRHELEPLAVQGISSVMFIR